MGRMEQAIFHKLCSWNSFFLQSIPWDGGSLEHTMGNVGLSHSGNQASVRRPLQERQVGFLMLLFQKCSLLECTCVNIARME